MTRKTFNYYEEIQNTRSRLLQLPPSTMPRNDLREARPRTDSKKCALIRIVAHTWKKAERNGFIVKTERGYKSNLKPPGDILAISQLESPLEKHMAIAAIITSELKKRGTEIVVAGSTAVELYTCENFKTMYVDLISTRFDNIEEGMTSLGFKNDNGVWYLPGIPDVVEFSSGLLDASRYKLQQVDLAGYGTFYMIGIEDMIIDRACLAKNWQDQSDTWICSMIHAKYDEIDWSYLSQKAEHQNVSEVINTCWEWVEQQRPFL